MRWLRRVAIAVSFICAVVAPGYAVQPDEVLPDVALEARARALSKELRCMVCQNQSIDDSDAPLARDLRVLVRDRLKAGDDDRQVIDYLVARYGEFVLLKPRISWHTALLWGLPPAALALGAIALFVLARRRATPESLAAGTAEPTGKLSPAEEARLAGLLKRGE
jgi:cytochrome c-type biogenesis protein CcmH